MFESVDTVVRKTVEIRNLLAEWSDSGYSLIGCSTQGILSWEGVTDNVIIAALKEHAAANDIVDGEEWKVLLHDEENVPCAVQNGSYIWLLWSDFALTSSLTMGVIKALYDIEA